MLIIAYCYKSALGKKIYKAVVCKDADDYRAVKEKIEEADCELIEFNCAYYASEILHEKNRG